jgi:hypothetical protein
MSKQWQWKSRTGFGAVLAVAVALGAAGAAGAGTLWRWQTEDGAIAYADDEKRIPERYRAQAEQLGSEALSDHPRFTPTDAAASQAYAEQLAARLAAMRAAALEDDAASGELAAGGAVARHPVSELALRTRRETDGRRLVTGRDGQKRWQRTTRTQTIDAPVPTVAFDADPNDPRPVVVETVRMRAGDSITTEHVTIVRQGDRVLSVVRPRDAQSSANWPRLEDYTD